MSLPEKPTTVRLASDLRAKAEDNARIWARGRTAVLSPYLEWAIRQVIELEFLSAENRVFVNGIVGELGEPWTALTVINVLLASMRREVRSGRLRPLFWIGQTKNGKH